MWEKEKKMCRKKQSKCRDFHNIGNSALPGYHINIPYANLKLEMRRYDYCLMFDDSDKHKMCGTLASKKSK
jgi:hypothetical protein